MPQAVAVGLAAAGAGVGGVGVGGAGVEVGGAGVGAAVEEELAAVELVELVEEELL